MCDKLADEPAICLNPQSRNGDGWADRAGGQSAGVVPVPIPGIIVSQADQNPALVYLASLGPSSRRTMRSARCDTSPGWYQVGSNSGNIALAHTSPAAYRCGACSVGKPIRCADSEPDVRRAARRVAGKRELGLMDAESFQRASRIKTIRGKPAPAGRALEREELRALFASCAGGDASASINVRDAALLAVLYGAGLRRAEVVQLDVSDLAMESGALVVHGKGNKVRLAYLPEIRAAVAGGVGFTARCRCGAAVSAGAEGRRDRLAAVDRGSDLQDPGASSAHRWSAPFLAARLPTDVHRRSTQCRGRHEHSQRTRRSC